MKRPLLAGVLATIMSRLSRNLRNGHNALAIALGAHGNMSQAERSTASSTSTSSATPSTSPSSSQRKSPRSVNAVDMNRLYETVTAFRHNPDPDRAVNLLRVLSKHRRGNEIVQSMIDQILDYLFLVGIIGPIEEVEPLETAVLYTQP